MKKVGKNAQKFSTPSNVELNPVELNVENTNMVESIDSQETSAPQEEPAQSQAIDNNAMLAIIQKMEEKQAQQAEEFRLKLAEQQELIESLAQEKEVLKAQTIKTIEPKVMRETLEKVEEKKALKETDLRKLGILKDAIENIDGVSVSIMRNGTDLLTRVTLTDAVIETLKNCLNRTESHIAKLDAQIQNLLTIR